MSDLREFLDRLFKGDPPSKSARASAEESTEMTKRVLKLSLLVAVLTALALAVMHVNRTMKVDSCLDGGGSWNYAKNTCSF
jgi:hypothetical protein